MNKLSCVLDMSVLRPICEETVRYGEAHGRWLWNCLFDRYQLAVPFVLIEEFLVRGAKPHEADDPAVLPEVLREMAAQIVTLESCWLDDVHEIAFRELVLGQPDRQFPAPPAHLVRNLFELKSGDPKLLEWIEDRRSTKERSVRARIEQQDRLKSVGEFDTATSEVEFFRNVVRGQLQPRLEDPAGRVEMLEAILGMNFRHRHPEHGHAIDEAFRNFTRVRSAQYPLTLGCVLASFFYFYAPLVKIVSSPKNSPRTIIKRSFKSQLNNLQDEQYVATALMCQRLLTADKGMKNLMEVFRRHGVWKTEAILIDRNRRLADQFPGILM
jgi:hypothetical protein